jgi:isopenicillin-N epimerase
MSNILDQQPTDEFWMAARAEMMLDPVVVNLNTGSFGPAPKPVFERATELRRQLGAEPTDFIVRRLPPLLWHAREEFARFLGGEPKRFLFATNVSVAINIVANGLTVASPGEILLTDHEYGAMHWCWERAAARQGLTLRTFPLPVTSPDPAEIVAAFVRAFTPRTRLLFFSHVLSPTGLVLPAREIVAEARRRGIVTVVDGAHAPAMIPLELDAVDADFYGGNGHKWLLAPIGAGFLYLGRNSIDRLTPLQVSWGYHHDRTKPDERDDFGSTPRLRELEFDGTRDFCPWLAVPTAIEFQTRLGWERVRERIAELAKYVRERLDGHSGLKLHTPPTPSLHGSLTAFRLPKTDSPWHEIRKRLWERGIEIPIIERPDGLLIRVSTHFYNTRAEIDLLASALPKVLNSKE